MAILTAIGWTYLLFRRRRLYWKSAAAAFGIALLAAAIAPLWGNPGWSMTWSEGRFWTTLFIYVIVFILGQRLLTRRNWHQALWDGLFQGVWTFTTVNFWG